VGDSLLRLQLEAHEAVHRAQAAAFPTCEAFLAGLTSARRIIDVELPAYCAQWRVAVAQGAEPVETRREFAWRIAAQSGAMENRLQVVQRFERECEPGSRSLTSLDHRGVPAEPPSLAGNWRAWFRLDTAFSLPFATRAREVTARLEFRPAPPVLPAPSGEDAPQGRPVHAGSLAGDFRPFGFALGTPEVLGWYEGGDTVRIILDPAVDHGHVELVGSRVADEVVGRWRLIGDPARAEGAFRLSRAE
jgi:hypothetical protein